MTQEDLFRREAVEFSTQRLYGHVVVLPKIGHTVAFLAVGISVVLLATALLMGVYVERQPVSGRLVVRNGHGYAELYIPRKLLNVVKPQQPLQLRLVEFSPGAIELVSAEIENISAEPKILRSDDVRNLTNNIYIPVTLRVTEEALRTAGLPLNDDNQFAIASSVVVSQKSWLRWVIEAISRSDARS